VIGECAEIFAAAFLSRTGEFGHTHRFSKPVHNAATAVRFEPRRPKLSFLCRRSSAVLWLFRESAPPEHRAELAVSHLWPIRPLRGFDILLANDPTFSPTVCQ
jgi:hypothetical protein